MVTEACGCAACSISIRLQVYTFGVKGKTVSSLGNGEGVAWRDTESRFFTAYKYATLNCLNIAS